MSDQRELDTWIADHLFGFAVHNGPCAVTTENVSHWHRDELHWTNQFKLYSSTWEGAGQVIEKMRERGWRFGLADFHDGPYHARFWNIAREGVAEELTVPMAVALAAKAAITAAESAALEAEG